MGANLGAAHGGRLYLQGLIEWFFKADARLVSRQNDGALDDG